MNQFQLEGLSVVDRFLKGADKRKIRDWMEIAFECVQQDFRPSESEKRVVLRVAETLGDTHRLRGAWSAPDRVVVAQLLDNQLGRSWQRGKVICFPYGWAGGNFGGSLTLTISLKGTEEESYSSCRVSIFLGDPMLEVIRDEPFTLAIVNGKQIVRLVRIDYSRTNSSRTALASFVDSLNEEGAKAWLDEDANFWETLLHHTVFHKYLTAVDQVSIGWVERQESLYLIPTILKSLRENDIRKKVSDQPLSDNANRFIEEVERCEGDFRVVRNFFLERFGSNLAEALIMFITEFSNAPDDAENGFVRSGIRDLLQAFYECATVTRCGRLLPWLSGTAELFTIEILPKGFPSHVSPREYWLRQTRDICFGWGHLLDGSDVPVSESELKAMINDLPTCDDARACLEQADFLLSEANINKQGCIPPEAIVQLRIGPFTSIELREIGNNVLVALRQSDGVVFYFTVEPDKCYWRVKFPSDENDSEMVSKSERATAALKLLIAAVIRDFWVVEHREMVFEQKKQESYPRNRSEMRGGPLIVYLPRIKYDLKANPNVESCDKLLDAKRRRSHAVTGHVRKSQHRSEVQLALAERYGFSVPVGYTFVRPHQRGKSQREVVYRSRSALQSLYTAIEPSADVARVSWFQFERDVKTLMQNLGFTVEHVAVSRNGDKGVDIFATKGTDLDAISWVIQCKCWNARRKVEPMTVRELIGTLTRYPSGTRGMVVTTSRFSSGAIEEAQSNNIRLMDGEEFMRLLRNEKSEN